MPTLLKLKTPVGEAVELGWEDFLAQFSPDAQRRIAIALLQPGVSGVVCFRNLAMDSSHYGEQAALVFGAGNTYKTLEECLMGRLGDVPSRFKYPVSFYLPPAG